MNNHLKLNKKLSTCCQNQTTFIHSFGNPLTRNQFFCIKTFSFAAVWVNYLFVKHSVLAGVVEPQTTTNQKNLDIFFLKLCTWWLQWLTLLLRCHNCPSTRLWSNACRALILSWLIRLRKYNNLACCSCASWLQFGELHKKIRQPKPSEAQT